VTAAFDRLGIAPTRDAKTIKRAYAVALKAIDQATEREAFERLRQAYEQALVWAARTDDAHDNDDPEPDPEPDDEDEEEDNEEEDLHDAQSAPGSSGDSAPAAPSAAEAHQALRHWTDQLRDAPPEAVATVLDAALADPRLLHLDSHAQLEARIAELLHDDPTGRAVLFDTAARRFHWTDRNARPIASAAAAHWISCVVNQGLQWEAQSPAVVDLQRQALTMAAQVAAPQPEQARRFAEVLADMARDFPDWFALHLGKQGHAHLPAWQASLATLAPQAVRRSTRSERYFGTWRKTASTLLGGFFVLMLVTGVLSGLMKQMLGNHASSAATTPNVAGGDASAKVGAGGSQAASEPVLAYEFTGAITRDSCESTEEFVHESNWLEVDDGDAIALLATRAMRCQDKGMWARKDDALLTCLRAERAAALGAGRSEDARRCMVPGSKGR